MTTEDEFQKALDTDLTDWHTRLVFADWLQDRDDPRAEGYRSLAFSARWPARTGCGWYWYARWPRVPEILNGDGHSTLVGDWWDAMLPGQTPFDNRRAAEDAAARAFALLPATRRTKLLNCEPVGVT